ncbi:hypothetical protein DL96DRAFT_1676470 [Flagelloscypha sp. PMI_526]|nr:hypothetical protein DL96DRAFT_1676470 [Flagelloscypha sp. PMI_526]
MTKPCLKRSPSSQSLNSNSSANHKSVHFGTVTPDCVHEADEWDRTPAAPALPLSYAEALELQAIQLSLPTVVQPIDPFTGKSLGAHGICGTKIPVALAPLLSDSSEWNAHPLAPPPRSRNTSPSSSPTHSPRIPTRPLPLFQTQPGTPPLATPAHLSFLSQLMPAGSPNSSRHNSRPPSPQPVLPAILPPLSPTRSRAAVTTTALHIVREAPEPPTSRSSPSLPTPPITPVGEVPPVLRDMPGSRTVVNASSVMLPVSTTESKDHSSQASRIPGDASVPSPLGRISFLSPT